MNTPNFSGRSDNLLLFTSGDRGVIIDCNFGVVVASGQSELLETSAHWGAGEFSELDAQLAQTAFAAMNSTLSVPTGRMYTVPRGVQMAAQRSLKQMNSFSRGGTDVSVKTATILASGGQITFEKLRHLDKYFARHENDKFSDAWNPATDGGPSAVQITWGLWGGDAGRKWAGNIMSREAEKAITADGILLTPDTDNQGDPFLDAFNLDAGAGPEFLARVRLDGTGIDRLYKIDLDAEVYVWDDGCWDNLGLLSGDIYQYDSELDDPYDTVPKTHIIIDSSSAVIIGAKLQNEPFSCISIEEIDEAEAYLATQAMYGIDWGLTDYAMTAAALSDEDGAQKAKSIVRDAHGKPATEGKPIIVGNNPAAGGVVTAVDPDHGTVNVQLHSGGTVTVPGRSISDAAGATDDPNLAEDPNPPAQNTTPPALDLDGILAPDPTPINEPDAHISTKLPSMDSEGLHDLLYNWPAWVNSERVKNADPERVDRPKHSKHPLVTRWLGKTNADGSRPRPSWQKMNFALDEMPDEAPATSPYSTTTTHVNAKSNGLKPLSDKPAEPDAVPSRGKKLAPKTSDVQPVYLAIVTPEDPTAVTQLVAIVPATTTSPSPTTYLRQNGTWVASPQTLSDLESATPPPVVPLNADILQDILEQVDQSQAKSNHKDNSTASGDAPTPVSTGAPITPPAGGTPSAAPAPAVASDITADQALMVMYGPKLDGLMSITAHGWGGNAETLRKYWTTGLGAAKIRWGEGGDFYRCVRHLAKYIDNPQGYCQDRHHDAIGIYTSTHAKELRKAKGK